MNTKNFYLYIVVIAYLIQLCCCADEKQPYIEIIDAKINGKSLEEAVNDVFDDITNQLFNKGSKSESAASSDSTAKVTPNEDDTLTDNLLDADELDEHFEDGAKPEKESKAAEPTTTAPVTQKTTQVITKTTTVVTTTPPKTTQVVQPTKAPAPPPASNNNAKSNSNSSSSSSNTSNSSSSSNEKNDNKVVPQPAPQPAPQPVSQPASQPASQPVSQPAPQSAPESAPQSAPQSAAEPQSAATAPQSNAVAPQPQEQPETQTQTQPQDQQSPQSSSPIIPANPPTNNQDQKLKGNVDGKNNEGGSKGILKLLVKIGLGIAAGGVCVAGLLVGKNKLSKRSESSSLPDSSYGNNTYGGAVMNLDPMDTFPTKGESYSQKLQPSNYLNPNVPTDTLPNNDFINTNSIEPLPNLVNKVDVELPIYNIQEEKYNTVGRQVDNVEPVNTWNDEDEITDETQLINKEGYNHIVPEMGEMVIENNHRPSLYAALEELEKEGGNNQKSSPNDNMMQIIPDIQYATVEVNNEFDNIDIDDEELGHQPGNDNMKQIIPDIQYATVEVNNEFAGIDEDESLDNSHSKVVVDIDAQRSSVASMDSDVQELRASQDFLAIPSNITNFKNISDTYRNALRDTFDAGNRDTLSSTDSILHKLR